MLHGYQILIKNYFFYMVYIWGLFHVFRFSILFSRSSRSLPLKVLSLDQQYQCILEASLGMQILRFYPTQPTLSPQLQNEELHFLQDLPVIRMYANTWKALLYMVVGWEYFEGDMNHEWIWTGCLRSRIMCSRHHISLMCFTCIICYGQKEKRRVFIEGREVT